MCFHVFLCIPNKSWYIKHFSKSVTLHKTQLCLENSLMETFEASTDSWNIACKAEHQPCLMISLGFSIKEASLPTCYSIKTLCMKTLAWKAKETYSNLDKYFLKTNTPMWKYLVLFLVVVHLFDRGKAPGSRMKEHIFSLTKLATP